MPRRIARALSSPMIQALDARRRSASKTSPAMAERSPEPANRCVSPHDFNASAAGRRSRSIASNISMAAASRAPGVMSKRSRQAEENTYGEDHPRHEQSRKPYAIERPAPFHDIAGGVLVG